MRLPSRRRGLLAALSLGAVALSPFVLLDPSVANTGPGAAAARPSASSTPTATPGPTVAPTGVPSSSASTGPSTGPSSGPTTSPSTGPATGPSTGPSTGPTDDSTGPPSESPTAGPTASPTQTPSSGSGSVLGGVLGGQLTQAQQQVEQFQQQELGPADDALPTAYPGLPPLTGSQWDGVGTTGLTEVVPSRQYLRVPASALAADVDIQGLDPVPPGFISGIQTSIKGYVVSPPGAEHPYGDFPPFRSKLLAFGILPVEATVHIDQLRDADDLPAPISGAQPGLFDENFFQQFPDATLSGQVQVRVSDVAVDGVPVDVGPGCRASQPSALTLRGKGYWSAGDDVTFWTLASNLPTPETILTPEQVEQDYYNVTGGGLLTGTIDISHFTGCAGPSGNLDRLISIAVSAAGQPISIRQSPNFNCFPPAINTTCEIPDPFPYPTS